MLVQQAGIAVDNSSSWWL